MDNVAKSREHSQTGTSVPAQAALTKTNIANPVSLLDSDDDDYSTEEDDDGSDAEGSRVAATSPSNPRDAGARIDPATAAKDVILVSKSELREMMREEIENHLKTIPPREETPVTLRATPLQSAQASRNLQNEPTQFRVPWGASAEASVPGVAGPATPPTPTSLSPTARHASMSSAGRAGSFTGTTGTSASQIPSRSFSHTQSSVIDEKWGQLFEATGFPTRRAEEVLKGLADHIIAEFVPQKSLVVTPEKLALFYSQHRLQKELFPFATMFNPRTDDQHVHDRIAELYQDLGCQYHLVQKNLKTPPTVPGLTPTGFARWLIANIQAYPDEEYQRLEAVALAVPLSVENSADCGRLERMPRMISRGLLPEQPDSKARKILDEALADFLEETTGQPPSPSVSRPLGLSIPWSPQSSAGAQPIPSPTRYDPYRYRPTREQQYRDRGASISSNSRMDSRGSGTGSGEWGTLLGDGGIGQVPRHGSASLSPVGAAAATEKERLQLPPPPVGVRSRSPQERRYSHSTVNVMQSQPPPPPPPAGGVYSPTSLMPEQLAAIRDRTPQQDREKEYYGSGGSPQKQHAASYMPARTSRGSLDSSGSGGGGVRRRESSGSYHREQRRERSPSARRRSGAAGEEARGQTWDEYLKHKGM